MPDPQTPPHRRIARSSSDRAFVVRLGVRPTPSSGAKLLSSFCTTSCTCNDGVVPATSSAPSTVPPLAPCIDGGGGRVSSSSSFAFAPGPPGPPTPAVTTGLSPCAPSSPAASEDVASAGWAAGASPADVAAPAPVLCIAVADAGVGPTAGTGGCAGACDGRRAGAVVGRSSWPILEARSRRRCSMLC